MPNLWGARRSTAEANAYTCLGKRTLNDAGRTQRPPHTATHYTHLARIRVGHDDVLDPACIY
jgi:hypothetical protein